MLLGGLLARAAGLPVEDFARQALFGPLGIEDYRWQFTPAGLAMTGGGLMLLGRDLLKLGRLYLAGGTWNGQRIVSEDWVRRSTAPKARINDATEYGYLWWLTSFGAAGPAYYMTGTGGNKVYVYPEAGLCAVITSINFHRQDAHSLSDRLLADFILPAAGLQEKES